MLMLVCPVPEFPFKQTEQVSAHNFQQVITGGNNVVSCFVCPVFAFMDAFISGK